VADEIVCETKKDWLSLLPKELGDFTANDLAKDLSIPKKLAQKMAYSLRKADIIELIGKKGRANLYAVKT
jgi:DNA-binding IscR family transcriptional regulator